MKKLELSFKRDNKASARVSTDVSNDVTMEEPPDDHSPESDAAESEPYVSFLLKKPFSWDEIDAIFPSFEAALSGPLQLIHQQGFRAYESFLVKERRDLELAKKREHEKRKESLKQSEISGSPRDYQLKLSEIAKQRNTIVHLGTGKGKTLIALLCIKHFMELHSEKKTLFLVPSVALAIQQTTTLQANLPYRVETACHTMTNSEMAHARLADADVLVATHGAIHDLLMHHADVFFMSNFALLVLDECHYATGNHMYATVLHKWYHPLPADERPHVLGLTASPLLHVKETHTDDQLEAMLSQLEATLNATVVSFPRTFDRDRSQPNISNAGLVERVVQYRGNDSSTDHNELPLVENSDLHRSRLKELKQLEVLYNELGPFPTSLYIQTLLKSASTNEFEKESVTQFRNMKKHLEKMLEVCRRQSQKCPHQGRTNKMLALEELLEEQIERRGGEDAVGLVFVERRITALALHQYYSSRRTRFDSSSLKGGSRNRTGQMLACSYQHEGGRNRDMSHRSVEDDSKDRHGITQPLHDIFMDAVENGKDEFDVFRKATPSKRRDHGISSSLRCASLTTQFMDAEKTSSVVADDLLAVYRGEREESDDETFSMSAGPQNSIDQFDDASSDNSEARPSFSPGAGCTVKSGAHASTVFTPVNRMSQFTNPSDSDSISGCSLACAGDDLIGDSHKEQSPELIRCGVMVRRPTNLFKISRNYEQLHGEKDIAYEEAEEFSQHEAEIKDVLRLLRNRIIHVLIATSIAEEGIDIQGCSFVVAFDSLRSTKAYIQMKGRARQKDAKFFVFEEAMNGNICHSKRSLCAARRIESRILKYIDCRGTKEANAFHVGTTLSCDLRVVPSSNASELDAVEKGGYSTEGGCVDLVSAKSLLNRYAMSVPLDPISRSTRDSFLVNMPVYADDHLMLPTHLPKDIRRVELPQKFLEACAVEKQNVLALMACVRLHKRRLISDRLLPLTRNDVQNILRKVVLKPLRSTPADVQDMRVMSNDGHREVYVQPVLITGRGWVSKYCELSGGEGRSLGFLTTEESLDIVPPFSFEHNNFGIVQYTFGKKRAVKLGIEQWDSCLRFMAVVFDSRWNRRTRREKFRARRDGGVLPPYTICSLSASGDIDWVYMERIVIGTELTGDQRIAGVHKMLDKPSVTPRPARLWAPTYDLMATYVVGGPSTLTCQAKFPAQIEGISTYQDYFRICKGVVLPSTAPLFNAQRLWHQPSGFPGESIFDEATDSSEFALPESNEPRMVSDTKNILLPQHACMETPMADPTLAPLAVLLPQFLYHVERILNAKAFVKHCVVNFSDLGKSLEHASIVRVADMLTAKSCGLRHFYDVFEWLGDGVLKVVQTNSVLDSPKLREWVTCLHVGDLSLLRSVMGANNRLAKICRAFDIHRFILTTPLARSRWYPRHLEFGHYTTSCISDSPISGVTPAPDICADVLEALLGLVLVTSGYSCCEDVANELGLLCEPTGPIKELDNFQKRQSSDEPVYDGSDHAFRPRQIVQRRVNECLGTSCIRNPWLVEEAFTHGSAIYQAVPSYQRLEWVGDAILCLAAREWLFQQFGDRQVKYVVSLESAIVSNETLAYVCATTGLHTFITYRDRSLPSRIELYQWILKDKSRGLWGTDPPKVLADVVEAVFGAVHVSGGFEESRKAVICMLRPILDVVRSYESMHHRLAHPKALFHEIGADLLRVTVSREDVFARSNGTGGKVWRGTRWSEPSEESGSYIAIVQCMGTDLVAVAESSRRNARNRVCALVVSAMSRNGTDLLRRFMEARKTVAVGLTELSSQTLST